MITPTPIDLKRSFDMVAAAAGMIAAVPPIIIASAIMAYVNKDTPFFTQTRVGQNGTPFKIYKIRTMRDIFNEQGLLLPAEERTSSIGKILRKSRIDELPQLFNILKGEMSLVGPRPMPADDFKAHHPLRKTIRPGLTGLSQISQPNLLSHDEILRLDQKYVENHTLWGDIKIILETPFALIRNWKDPHHRQDREMVRHI